MPVTLVNPFVVPPGREEAFLKTWSQTAEAVQGAPGFISATLHQAMRPDAHFSFVNIAQWESEELYQAAFAKNPVPDGAVRPEAYPALYRVVRTY